MQENGYKITINVYNSTWYDISVIMPVLYILKQNIKLVNKCVNGNLNGFNFTIVFLLYLINQLTYNIAHPIVLDITSYG